MFFALAQRPYHRAPIDDVQISTPVIVGIAIAAALLLALIIGKKQYDEENFRLNAKGQTFL